MTDKNNLWSNSAHVAHKMAKEMWWETHRKDPSVEDFNFIILVRICSAALQVNNHTPDSLKEWHDKLS